MFLILIGLLKKFVFKDLEDEYVMYAIAADFITILVAILATGVIIKEIYKC